MRWIGLIFLLSTCQPSTTQKLPAVPYGEHPPTPSFATMRALEVLPIEQLNVRIEVVSPERTLRHYELEGIPYSGWVFQRFPDHQDQHRYLLLDQGLVVWQIGYFPDGILDHDFHLDEGFNRGSQRMWYRQGQAYINTYFLPGGKQHGWQYRYYASGGIARMSWYDQGTELYHLELSAEGDTLVQRGVFPDP